MVGEKPAMAVFGMPPRVLSRAQLLIVPRNGFVR